MAGTQAIKQQLVGFTGVRYAFECLYRRAFAACGVRSNKVKTGETSPRKHATAAVVLGSQAGSNHRLDAIYSRGFLEKTQGEAGAPKPLPKPVLSNREAFLIYIHTISMREFRQVCDSFSGTDIYVKKYLDKCGRGRQSLFNTGKILPRYFPENGVFPKYVGGTPRVMSETDQAAKKLSLAPLGELPVRIHAHKVVVNK